MALRRDSIGAPEGRKMQRFSVATPWLGAWIGGGENLTAKGGELSSIANLLQLLARRLPSPNPIGGSPVKRRKPSAWWGISCFGFVAKSLAMLPITPSFVTLQRHLGRNQCSPRTRLSIPFAL